MRNYLNKIISSLVILAFLFNPLGVMGASNTLGAITAETYITATSSANVLVWNYTTGNTGGTVKTARIKNRVSGGSAGSAMVIYADNGSGDPGTLLATSDEVTVTWTSTATTTYTFSAQNQINLSPNTTYYVGIHYADPGVPTFGWGISVDTATASECVFSNFNDTYPGAETTFSVEDNYCFETGNLDVTFDSPEGVSYPLINPNLDDSGLRIDFDGVDERLVSANNPSFSTDTKTNGRSICLWFNMDNVPASETSHLLWNWSGSDGQGNWSFRMRTDRAVHGWSGTRFEMQTANDTGGGSSTSTFMYSSATTFAASTLYHICYISSGSAWSLYVNGSSVTLTVGAAGVGGNDGDWWGNVAGSGTITFGIGAAAFDGKIDDVSYYDDDLTAAEVLRLYNGGKPVHPLAVGLTDLSGFWKLGEDADGSITTIHDAQGDDNFSSVNGENADIVRTNYY